MFDRFMNRRVELLNGKEIETTFTVLGTIRTAVGRNVEEMEQNTSENLFEETCKQVLLYLCALFNRKPMQFLKHRSCTGLSTSV